MTTTKPYLIRAIRQWALDNELTPQILVDALADGVKVPEHYVSDGQIILNIGAQAVQMDAIDNELLRFSARFNGVRHEIEVPVSAVLAIYARENGQGIFFKEADAKPPAPPSDAGDEGRSGRSHLKLVK